MTVRPPLGGVWSPALAAHLSRGRPAGSRGAGTGDPSVILLWLGEPYLTYEGARHVRPQPPPSWRPPPCSPPAAAPTPTRTPEATTSSGAFPVTVDTAFGDVTVEEEPVRVVALGWSDAETALALGVQPVGASDWLGFGGEGVGPWAEGRYDEAPEIIETLEPSYEAIAALEPDLILDTRSAATQERYDLLSEIAPTIGQPEGVGPYQTTWQQQLELVGAALGKDDEAAALQDEVDQAFTDAAAANPGFEGTEVAVGAYTSEGFGAYVRGDSRVDFMEQLGFVNKPAIQDLAGENFFVPGERRAAVPARRPADRRLPDLRRGVGDHRPPAVVDARLGAAGPRRRPGRRDAGQRLLQRLGARHALRAGEHGPAVRRTRI